MSNPPRPEHTSYWQKGVDDARAGLCASLERHLPKNHFGTYVSCWQRSLMLGGYLNGYNYGKYNKKAP